MRPLIERIPNLRELEAKLVAAGVYEYSQERDSLEMDGRLAINEFSGYSQSAYDVIGEDPNGRKLIDYINMLIH